ncbi:MAG: hypothetical protein DMD83_09100, partial [Candidatus Rokuibacteriota bacterium]
MAQRSARLQRDLGVPLTETDALRRHLERNPVDAWAGGTGSVAYFSYTQGRFATRFTIPSDRRAAFQERLKIVSTAAPLARCPPFGGSAQRLVQAGARPLHAPKGQTLQLKRELPT